MNESSSTDQFTSETSPSAGAVDTDKEPPEPGLQIEVANEQTTLTIDEERLQVAVEGVLLTSSFLTARISIAVVDDSSMQVLNRQYLQHDWPTDVLSFVLHDEPPHLEGEIVVSADTAARCADDFGWSPGDELLLYVIHGALHLVGFSDKTPSDRAKMCREELAHLQRLRVQLPKDCSRWDSVDSHFG